MKAAITVGLIGLALGVVAVLAFDGAMHATSSVLKLTRSRWMQRCCIVFKDINACAHSLALAVWLSGTL